MTFLNPLVLIGLAAAAIPIILHLLNLRKLKIVEFSSLRFLKELQKTRMRRVRIRQWLLLLLRTLMIVALVLAFARPALRGTLAGTIGTHARTSSVVILDDSPSMGVRGERGVLFARAKEAAVKAAGLLKEGDEITILPLSWIRGKEAPSPARNTEEALSTLLPTAVSSITVPYREAFAVAARILSASQNFNREIHLLSDLQKAQFAAGSDTMDLFEPGVRVFVSAPSPQSRDNAGIARLQVTSRILAPGRPATIQTLIRNFGTTAVRNGLLSVYLDGARVLQQSLDVPASGSVAPSLAVTPKRRGIITGYLQIEDDALEPDNRRFFVLGVPEKIHVLVVGRSEQATRLPLLALSPGSDSAAGALRVQAIDEAQLSSVDPGRFDVVVTCGLRDFSASEGSRLGAFVKAGGGLLVFPGEGADIANYNASLFSPLGVPPAQDAVRHTLPGMDQQAGGYLSITAFDFAHPLFDGLFDDGVTSGAGKRTLESPHVYQSIVLHTGTRGQAIMTLSDGTPFLAEYPAGAGRVLVAAVEAGLTWSDLPLRGMFVPLLHRSAAYLAAHHEPAPSFLAGERTQWTIRIPERTAREEFVVRAPDDTEEKVVARYSPASGTASITADVATSVGVYALRQESAGDTSITLAAAAVNPDPAESDLAQADDAALRTFWNAVGLAPEQVVQLGEGDDLGRAVEEARFGVELWKYLAGLAALLALLEMVIGRVPRNAALPGESS